MSSCYGFFITSYILAINYLTAISWVYSECAIVLTAVTNSFSSSEDIYSSIFVSLLLEGSISVHMCFFFLNIKYGENGFAQGPFPDQYDTQIIAYLLEMYSVPDNSLIVPV